MSTGEAILIVLSLAEGNVITERQAAGCDVLQDERDRQLEAIRIFKQSNGINEE